MWKNNTLHDQSRHPVSRRCRFFPGDSGNYDPAADTLVLNDVRFFYTYTEDGELDLDADRQEEAVSAVFAFDDEGYLVVPESTDPSIMGWKYETDTAICGMWMWAF